MKKLFILLFILFNFSGFSQYVAIDGKPMPNTNFYSDTLYNRVITTTGDTLYFFFKRNGVFHFSNDTLIEMQTHLRLVDGSDTLIFKVGDGSNTTINSTKNLIEFLTDILVDTAFFVKDSAYITLDNLDTLLKIYSSNNIELWADTTKINGILYVDKNLIVIDTITVNILVVDSVDANYIDIDEIIINDTLGSYGDCVPFAYIDTISGCSPTVFKTGLRSVGNIDLIANSIMGTSVDINNSELQQVSNIGATTISGTQFGYLGGMNQDVKNNSHVQFQSGLFQRNINNIAENISVRNYTLTIGAGAGVGFYLKDESSVMLNAGIKFDKIDNTTANLKTRWRFNNYIGGSKYYWLAVSGDSIYLDNNVDIAGNLTTSKYVSDTSIIASSSDAVDVADVTILVVNTTGGNVTIGGFTGGEVGQILYVISGDDVGNIIIEDDEGTGNQDIKTNTGADVTITAEGGTTLIFLGTYWKMIGL